MEINLQLFFYQYATQMSFSSLCGKRIDFLNSGTWNMYSGPDFKMVQYAINDVISVGDVEIHTKSSDWFKHGHHKDPAFDHVAIHFVSDCNVVIRDNMVHIQAPSDWTSYPLEKVNVRNPITFNQDYKRQRLHQWADLYGFENAAFIHLARALGRHVQGDAMELLAILLLPLIGNQNLNTRDISILFHGVAGQLNDDIELPFYQSWKTAFCEANIQQLAPLPWNNKVNIPSRQCLKVSQLIHLHFLLRGSGYATLLNQPNAFRCILKQIQGMSYWESHYRFGQRLAYKSSVQLSSTAQEGIFMNTIPIWELAFQK
jgi:hypothetical protein